MKAKLPIFHNTEKTSALHDINVDYPLSECELRDVLFYEITSISDYIEKGKHYTTLFSGGNEFICALKIEEIERIIDECEYTKIKMN